MLGKPINSRVTVEIDRLEEREVGGIIIPAGEGEHLKDAQWGKCVAVCDTVTNIKKGQMVLLPRMCGHDHYVGEKKYVITKAEDILAVDK